MPRRRLVESRASRCVALRGGGSGRIIGTVGEGRGGQGSVWDFGTLGADPGRWKAFQVGTSTVVGSLVQRKALSRSRSLALSLSGKVSRGCIGGEARRGAKQDGEDGSEGSSAPRRGGSCRDGHVEA